MIDFQSANWRVQNLDRTWTKPVQGLDTRPRRAAASLARSTKDVTRSAKDATRSAKDGSQKTKDATMSAKDATMSAKGCDHKRQRTRP